MILVLGTLVLIQVALALSVAKRFGRVIGEERVPLSDRPGEATVSMIVPVLNEEERITRCLDAVIAEALETPEIVQILVVDGGSTDRTVDIARTYADRDRRIAVVDASPVPADAAGKAWGLNAGLDRAAGEWILTLDADSIIGRGLTRSLLAFATKKDVAALSIATRQSAPGHLYSMLHPAFLTTLVYRFGPPGFITRDVHDAIANGQCFFASKAAVNASNAFRSSLSSLCEDITIARTLARSGYTVGFFEADVPVDVEMYSSAREVWHNWPRSLIMRDQYFDTVSVIQLARVLLVQAAPLPLAVASLAAGLPLWFVGIQTVMAAVRIGVLFGTRGAYVRRTPAFWLSPALDLPVAIRLIQYTCQRRFVWRGRVYVMGQDGTITAL